MPNYYLISEVPDQPGEPIHENIVYKKPVTYDLLLPSLHCSRADNVLVCDSDAHEAVTTLRDTCSDAATWPSSLYGLQSDGSEQGVYQESVRQEEAGNSGMGSVTTAEHVDEKPTVDGLLPPPKPPVYAKYKPPFWSYDAVEPHVIDAARALFFERRRQQAVYGAVPTWNNPSGVPRIPTDYELFAAWASLPRADKMTYISEVSGGFPVNPFPRNTLETQRAVSVLYSSCPDSTCWPSFQFGQSPPAPRHLINNHLHLPYKFE